MTNIW